MSDAVTERTAQLESGLDDLEQQVADRPRDQAAKQIAVTPPSQLPDNEITAPKVSLATPQNAALEQAAKGGAVDITSPESGAEQANLPSTPTPPPAWKDIADHGEFKKLSDEDKTRFLDNYASHLRDYLYSQPGVGADEQKEIETRVQSFKDKTTDEITPKQSLLDAVTNKIGQSIRSTISGVAKGATVMAQIAGDTNPQGQFNPPAGAKPMSNLELLQKSQADPLFKYARGLDETTAKDIPVDKRMESNPLVKVAGAVAGFLPALTGPAAPLVFGSQALGDTVSNQYQNEIAAGKTPEQAADTAFQRGLKTGGLQFAVWAALPGPLRAAFDKFLVRTLGKTVISRFLAQQVSEAGQGMSLGAASRISENLTTDQPLTKDVVSSAVGLGALNVAAGLIMHAPFRRAMEQTKSAIGQHAADTAKADDYERNGLPQAAQAQREAANGDRDAAIKQATDEFQDAIKKATPNGESQNLTEEKKGGEQPNDTSRESINRGTGSTGLSAAERRQTDERGVTGRRSDEGPELEERETSGARDQTPNGSERQGQELGSGLKERELKESGGGESKAASPLLSKWHEKFAAEQAAKPAPNGKDEQPTQVSTPRIAGGSAEEVAHNARRDLDKQISLPKGASAVRVIDQKGRKSIVSERDLKGANPLHEAGPFTKMEAGTIGKRGEFIPMKEPIALKETEKLNAPAVADEEAIKVQSAETARQPREEEKAANEPEGFVPSSEEAHQRATTQTLREAMQERGTEVPADLEDKVSANYAHFENALKDQRAGTEARAAMFDRLRDDFFKNVEQTGNPFRTINKEGKQVDYNAPIRARTKLQDFLEKHENAKRGDVPFHGTEDQPGIENIAVTETEKAAPSPKMYDEVRNIHARALSAFAKWTGVPKDAAPTATRDQVLKAAALTFDDIFEKQSGQRLQFEKFAGRGRPGPVEALRRDPAFIEAVRSRVLGFVRQDVRALIGKERLEAPGADIDKIISETLGSVVESDRGEGRTQKLATSPPDRRSNGPGNTRGEVRGARELPEKFQAQHAELEQTIAQAYGSAKVFDLVPHVRDSPNGGDFAWVELGEQGLAIHYDPARFAAKLKEFQAKGNLPELARRLVVREEIGHLMDPVVRGVQSADAEISVKARERGISNFLSFLLPEHQELGREFSAKYTQQAGTVFEGMLDNPRVKEMLDAVDPAELRNYLNDPENVKAPKEVKEFLNDATPEARALRRDMFRLSAEFTVIQKSLAENGKVTSDLLRQFPVNMLERIKDAIRIGREWLTANLRSLSGRLPQDFRSRVAQARRAEQDLKFQLSKSELLSPEAKERLNAPSFDSLLYRAQKERNFIDNFAAEKGFKDGEAMETGAPDLYAEAQSQYAEETNGQSLFAPTDEQRADVERQGQFLTEFAKAHGFDDLNHFALADPALFNEAASQYRTPVGLTATLAELQRRNTPDRLFAPADGESEIEKAADKLASIQTDKAELDRLAKQVLGSDLPGEVKTRIAEKFARAAAALDQKRTAEPVQKFDEAKAAIAENPTPENIAELESAKGDLPPVKDPAKPSAQALNLLPHYIDVNDALGKKWAETRAFFKAGKVKEYWSAWLNSADTKAKVFSEQKTNDVRGALREAMGRKINAPELKRDADALTVAVEADGDKTKLAEFRKKVVDAQTNPEVKKSFGWTKQADRYLSAVSHAEKNWDRLQSAADIYKKTTGDQLSLEHLNGMDTPLRNGYVPHMQELDVFGTILGDTSAGGSPLGFKKMRSHDTFADSLAAGIKPKSIDAIDLLNSRLRKGNEFINRQQWAETGRSLVDPTTNLPVVADPIVESHPVTGDSQTRAPAGYQLKTMGFRQVAVHNGYSGFYDVLTAPSQLRNVPLMGGALKTEGAIKHGLLIFDSFHLGRLAYYSLPFRGLNALNFRDNRGVLTIDYSDTELHNMERRGELPNGVSANDLIARKADAHALIEQGLNVGGIAENINNDLIRNLRGIGTFNKFVFEQFQRSAMVQTGLIELARQRKSFPELSEQQLSRQVAKDINTRFGNLLKEGWFKSDTMRDLAQLTFLAPSWNEGLMKSEYQFYKQGGQAIGAGLQGRLQVGTMLRGSGSILLGMFVMNQIINLGTRGQPTWMNKEEGINSKISAWIPDVIGHGPGFFLNPLTLPSEISHQVLEKIDQGQTFEQAVSTVIGYKFSPLARAGFTLKTGTDRFGRTLNTRADLWSEVASDLVPAPISGKTIVQAVIASGKAGKPVEPFKGAIEKQAFASAGVKLDSAPSDLTRVNTLAKDFNKAKGITPDPRYSTSDYHDLNQALYVNDEKRAAQEYAKLAEKKTPYQMSQHYRHAVRYPFTGQARREREFYKSLNSEQQETYKKAIDARRQLREAFLAIKSSAPTTKPTR